MKSNTLKNLESAFAGECMAHIKYLYFANICHAKGDKETALLFETIAAQEIRHAFGHADLLFPATTMSVEKCLELAIKGETYEYAEMYPEFKHTALEEKQQKAVQEFDAQIQESKEHAKLFQQTLKTAAKRFEALTKVEKQHAKRYEKRLQRVHK